MQDQKHAFQDTIVALATPQGQGAIGVIRVSGPDAIRVCNQVFRGKNLEKADRNTVHFGTIRAGDEVLDEVLATIFRAPKSFTGEDSVEVSCHGSDYILQKVLHLLIDQGCRAARPGEFTQRAFLNGKMDLSQAEAVADLIAADNAGAHDLALKQMRGGFSDQIKALRAELIQFAALVELELDFSEEDVEFADRQRLIDLITHIREVLQQLIASFSLGNVIKDGVATVIAGRPNAGKSTLLNALLQEERAIVSHIAGTTRDTIEESLIVEGIKFRLIDTAGIRDAVDTIESIGVRKTMEQIAQASLVLYVFDLCELRPEQLKQDLEKLDQGIRELVIANKKDLFKGDLEKFRKAAGDRPFLAISSKEHESLDELLQLLARQFRQGRTTEEGTIISNTRHRAALIKADESLKKVLDGIELNISGDMLATDIRLSLDALGEITGEITHEDLLDDIFSKFCIGK